MNWLIAIKRKYKLRKNLNCWNSTCKLKKIFTWYSENDLFDHTLPDVSRAQCCGGSNQFHSLSKLLFWLGATVAYTRHELVIRFELICDKTREREKIVQEQINLYRFLYYVTINFNTVLLFLWQWLLTKGRKVMKLYFWFRITFAGNFSGLGRPITIVRARNSRSLQNLRQTHWQHLT